MASKDNIDNFSDHIMNAIAEKRTAKNVLTIHQKIASKPTIQGMASYFLISNDQLNENEVTEGEPISFDISTTPPSNISDPETSSNC